MWWWIGAGVGLFLMILAFLIGLMSLVKDVDTRIRRFYYKDN